MTLDEALSVFARAGLSGKVGYFDVATAQALADLFAELDAAQPVLAAARAWRTARETLNGIAAAEIALLAAVAASEKGASDE